nr:rRNA (cytosine1402-N4)-methyltransferase [Candidatus Cloacimonadota bacterium]
MSRYHQPVMLETCIRELKLKDHGIYVDATLGGGGHSLGMLKANPNIRLFAIDQDADAIAEASELLQDYPVTIIKANFQQLRTQLAYHKVKGIDGILFDLGVSSYQLDEAERGFSFDKDAILDMRMDRDQNLTAKDLINESSVDELKRIFKEYGEDAASGRIARAVEKARQNKEIVSTKELADIIESVVGTGSKESLKSKVRIFQALRIEVNNELGVLSSVLTDAINLLNPGGRIVVMSYHSLEDRIVKNAFRLAAQGCICPPAMIHCTCDHKRQLKIISKRPLVASADELAQNIRSRSVKLRVAEKIEGKK